MDHQDWNPVVLNNTTTKLKQSSINKHVSQKASDDTLKVIARKYGEVTNNNKK